MIQTDTATPVEQPFTSANDRPDDVERLQEQLRADGYLFVRGLAPREEVERARRDVLEICAEAGWCRSGEELMRGIWSGAGPYTENEPEYMAVYRRVLRLESFNALPEHPVFRRFMEKLLGGEIVVHRRHIGRITFPDNQQQTTAAHQDWQYIRGTPETYTIWMPLGDCPRELGGLSVLNGSHKQGFIEHQVFKEKKYAASGLADEQLPQGEGIAWHTGDFAMGDVLIFHSHTIHKALPNLTSDRLRLSTDNRYQRAGTAIEPGSMGTHYNLV